MKPVTTIVVILLFIVSIGHLLRIVLQVEIIAAGIQLPVWLSIVGCIVSAILALLLWRENRK